MTQISNLTTQIYTKISTQPFLSRFCPTHPTSMPIYLCTGCFPTSHLPQCEQCFRDHQCDKKGKGQIVKWIAGQQEKVGKLVNFVLGDWEARKQGLGIGKLELGGKEKYIVEVNKEIVARVTQVLSKQQKSIEENCIKPALESMDRTLIDNYIAQIKLQLNGLSAGKANQISTFTEECQKNTKEVRVQIQNQSKNIMVNCSEFYRESVKNSILGVLKEVFGITESNEQKQKAKSSNVDEKIKKSIAENFKKQIQAKSEKIKELQQKIYCFQQQIKVQNQIAAQHDLQNSQLARGYQKQLQTQQKKSLQLQQKLQKYQSLPSQLAQKDILLRKLQSKCQIYENQLAQFARGGAANQDKVQSRYNMIQIANKLTEVSRQYEEMIIQCNAKDKKISDLIVELSKAKIRKTEERVNNSSGKKSNQ